MRFLASIGLPGAMIPEVRSGSSAAADAAELTVVVDERFIRIAIAGEPALHFDGGVILGPFWRAGDRRPVASLSDAEAARARRTAGASLIDDFWGAYVAFTIDVARRDVTVIRAPFGELPCLFANTRDGIAVASDVALLVSLTGVSPVIDWTEVSRHLAIRNIVSDRTCLGGIGDLPGGSMLLTVPHLSTKPVWSPWRFASPSAAFASVEDATTHVREAVIESVATRADGARVVLTLSGGLDSSIVAASLHDARIDFTPLNLTTRDRAGDEIDFAEAVAQATGRSLVTVERDVTRIDLARSEAAYLPRPVARAFAQESRRAALSVADAIGSTMIFNGGGGDNLFCSLQSGSPAADVLRAIGPGRTFVAALTAMSRFATASMFEVARDAAARAWFGKHGLLRPISADLLSDRAVADATSAPVHPWLDAPPDVPPGKAGHVRLLAFAQSFVQSFDPLDRVRIVAPLLSQPLIETCLRVPSWWWFENGHNRVVARRAFRDDLPARVVWRRSKGSPESFVGEVFERYRSTLTALLLDGLLAKEGVIDRAAVEAVVRDDRPAHGTAFLRVLELADAEAWARAWQEGAVTAA